MKKHGPNTARKFNHDGYSCKNTVLIVTAMGKTEKTRSKWATMRGMSNKVLIVTARLQLSSIEYTRHFIKEVMELSEQNPEPILAYRICKLFYGENWQACIS